MRLDKIKMAGFKSFVDPTTLELRSPLVAVVGPNGCGKSNIIDAIRWVMGESSAKNLRGESMTDVIFNGSSSRKPIGQASVELVFDNSDGSLGGEYARFTEISVKRQATRDGQSTYFLNGTRCRRKDITDVFLGTGLGPRSYAIIEQGMISRVIEARPEELRSFFEEAAGTSLYRKRRHETEIRMRHTRENLERLNDVRQELDKQLERLKRQSEAANRYKEYKIEHDRLEAELGALRWQVYHEKLEAHASAIRTLSLQVEEKVTERTHLDVTLEKERLVHAEKLETWKVEQSQYYDLGTQVARVEQTLTHHREREESLQTDFTRAEEEYQRVLTQDTEDKERLQVFQADLLKLEPDAINAKTVLEEALKVQRDAEEAMRHWNEAFETFQKESEEAQRTAEVEKTRIEQLERQSRDRKTQLDRLERESAEMDLSRIEQNIVALEEERSQKGADVQSQEQLTDISNTLTEKRQALVQAQKALDELRGQLQKGLGRLSSLEALQQAALGKNDRAVKEWLSSHGFQDLPRLGEVLTVEPGYEKAVEGVLGAQLEALCASDEAIVNKTADIESLQTGTLTFMTKGREQDMRAEADLSQHGLAPLISFVKSSYPVQAFLHGIYVAEDLATALAMRQHLSRSQSIVTRSGIWVGPSFLKISRGNEKEGQGGVLAREAELKTLGDAIEQYRIDIEQLEHDVVASREQISALEQKREALQKQQQEEARLLNEFNTKIHAERTRLEHLRARMARILSEKQEHTQKLETADEETALSRLALQTALDAMEVFTKKRVTVYEERDRLRDLLKEVNQKAGVAKENAHVFALKEQTLITQIKAIEEGLLRLGQQEKTITDRKTNLQTQLAGLKEPQELARLNLEELLAKHVVAETAVNQSRSALDALEEEMRVCEKKRQGLEEALEALRANLEQARMDWQAVEVRCETIKEQFVAASLSIEQVLQTLPEGASESVWAEGLESIAKKIERLGAINLAAIEEFETESERKQYLDAQHADLAEALETLEDAIRKIDKETRVRFQETFDKVNNAFQSLFPVLFGGGQANLELMGEDILEAGVTVMARPPGKRNSSIHLLSGGEKALTAVALVFAIFQLNPAPFCLLDEVDAPLDDSNVVRFRDLVKKLSDTVQFIFVTHNKLAMEIAHHLVGVTMKEPGVSRLVSVDVEEAVALVG